MKPYRPFISRISSFIVDLSIVYSFSLIVNFFVPFNQYIGILQIFILLLILYTLICIIVFSFTPGKYLFKLYISTNSNEKPAIFKLLIREIIFKYLSILLIYFSINYLIANSNSNLKTLIDINLATLIALIFSFLLFLIIWIFTKKAWWDSLTGLTIKKMEIPTKRLKNAYLSVFVFLGISFLLIFVLNNKDQNHNYSFLGFKYPLNFKKHIANSSVNEHIAFLRDQKLSHKDYIFELFSKYDIVVLCESSHREVTQWDFISEIIHDDRFIHQVGNIFTEYGASSKQAQVDAFLSGKFTSDTILSQETAKLTNFMNAGFYNFMRSLNKLNNTLPDSLQIHEYFTDFDIYHEYIRTSENPYRLNRDSLMASIVINKYRDFQERGYRKKCLVVTNTRHAYGLVKKDGIEVSEYNYNEARYIFKEFPNETANVLINSMSRNRFQFPYPIHYGLWDKAFEGINHKQVGFNFKNTPFGEDKFDLFPWANVSIQYQDIFTGFVYVRPTEEWRFSSYYPFRQYAANKEYHEKLEKGVINSGSIIESFKHNKFKDETIWIIFQGFYNLIPYIFYFLFIVPGLIILLIYGLKLSKYK